MAQLDGVRKGYLSSNYALYDFHGSQALSKHAVYPHRYPQHNLRPDYDAPVKLHASSLHPAPGTPYPKHQHPSASSSNSHNSSIPQFPSHEVSKSSVQAQAQQTQVNHNFSPVSNSSPVASGLQSPNCSSSPSPLMGAPEGSGNAASQPPRNSHSRILQAAPQLSPAPSSNSSSSSCGSSIADVDQRDDVTHVEKNEQDEEHKRKEADEKSSEKSEDWKSDLPRSESVKSESRNKQKDKELITPERQKNRNKEHDKSKQAGSAGASVIQQSLSVPLAILDGNIKQEEGERDASQPFQVLMDLTVILGMA
ncbi:transcription factor 20 [Arapaima gigas]